MEIKRLSVGSRKMLNIVTSLPVWIGGGVIFTLLFLINQDLRAQFISCQRQLGPEHGLLESTIFQIAQDGQGFVYMGSSSGISRFDGYEFLNFKGESKHVPNKLFGRNIRSICSLSPNLLLIGTDRGVNLYSCISKSFLAFYATAKPSELSDNPVTALCLDPFNRKLWVGTQNGLQVLDPYSKFPRPTSVDPTKNQSWIKGIVSNGSSLWVASDEGLWEFDPISKKYRGEQLSGTMGVKVYAICYDSADHRVWAGTSSGEILLREDGRWRQVDSIGFQINAILSSDRDLWVGTGRNLLRYNVTELLAGSGKPTLIDGTAGVLTLYLSPQDGLLWVGRYLRGVSIVDPKCQNEFVSMKYDRQDTNGLAMGHVWAIYQGSNPDDKIWLGLNRKGLDCYNPADGTFAHYGISGRELPSRKRSVLSIMEDSGRNLWIGTINGGLFRCPRNSLGEITKFEEMDKGMFPRSRVTSLCEDGEGKIWIAVLGDGLFYFDKASEVIRKYEPPSSIRSENFSKALSLFHDSRDKDHLWVGTTGKGFLSINLKDNSKTKNYCQNCGATGGLVRDNAIHSITSDRNSPNILWLATGSSGIVKFDKKRGREVLAYNDAINGFPDNDVYAVKQDYKGNLWFSTNFGIAELDPSGVQPIIVRRYTEEDGLGSREFNDGAHFMNEQTGDIFFGSVNGYCMINPKKLEMELETAKIPELMSLQIEGENKQPGDKIKGGMILPDAYSKIKELKVEEGHTSIRMSFSTFSYRRPRRFQFEYNIFTHGEPLEKSGWMPFQLTDRITGKAIPGNILEIFDLPPGEHLLVVRTKNIQTRSSSKMLDWKGIKIHVVRPFHKQPLLYAIIGLVTFGVSVVAFLFHRNRRRMLREAKENREAATRQRIAEEALQRVQEEQATAEQERATVVAELENYRRDFAKLGTQINVLDQSVAKKTRQFESWNTIAETLATNPDLGASLPAMFEAISHSMPLDSISIGRLTEDGKSLLYDWNLIRTPEGLAQAPAFTRPNDPSKSIGGRCIEQQMKDPFGKVEVILHWLTEDERNSLTVAREETQSLAGCCMVVEKEIVGVLMIKSFEPYAYTSEQLVILRAVATTCGIAIKNALLTRNLKSEKDARTALANSLGHDIRSLFGLLDHQWVKPIDSFFQVEAAGPEGTQDLPPGKIGRLLVDESRIGEVETMGWVPIRAFLSTFAKLGSTWTGHFRQEQISMGDHAPRNLQEAILAAWDFAKEVAVVSVLRMHKVDTPAQLTQLGSFRHALRRLLPDIEFQDAGAAGLELGFSNPSGSDQYASLMRFFLTLFMNVLKHCNPAGKVMVQLAYDEESRQVELTIINHTWPDMNPGEIGATLDHIAGQLVAEGRVDQDRRYLVKSIYNARDFGGLSSQDGTAWKTPETLRFLLETKLNGKIQRFQPRNVGENDKELWETVCTFVIN